MADSTNKQLLHRFLEVRQQTENLCKPLTIEDYTIQSMEDVSPPKWHLAHTTWFFETFLLKPYVKSYKIFDELFCYLFNSYYHGIGPFFPRDKRGTLSRPPVDTIYQYRRYVDEHITRWVQDSRKNLKEINNILILGIHHEQQHQELLLMDIKYNFSRHPSFPSYKFNGSVKKLRSQSKKLTFDLIKGGIIDIGNQHSDFCYDNELPRHKKLINPYYIANRLVTNEEYLEFMDAKGYQNPVWWLMDGWIHIVNNKWKAPLYWYCIDHDWYEYTLSGLKKIIPEEPVTHISFYEADAYARWRGMRLPLEEEWEHAVIKQKCTATNSNFMEKNILHPENISQSKQFFGDCWEWTNSAYSPYPGFKPLVGIMGEYNGKFMNNQKVLRGGSCVTPESHIRSSYRNYFAPEKRWQFSGIRLAKDAEELHYDNDVHKK